LTSDYPSLPSSSSHQRQSSIHVKQQQRIQQNWLKKIKMSIQNKKRVLLTGCSILICFLLIWFFLPNHAYQSLTDYNTPFHTDRGILYIRV
jgi:plastocyanin domain-containing protein